MPYKAVKQRSARTAAWFGKSIGCPVRITTPRQTVESDLFPCSLSTTRNKKDKIFSLSSLANGLIEEFQRPLKAALKAYNTDQWSAALPTLLLGFRSVFKEDLQATTAELSLDVISIRDPVEIKSRQVADEETVAFFRKTIKRNEDKRYEELDLVLPIVKQNFSKLQIPDDGIRVTWMGHSTVLVQMHGLNVLTDPQFSDLCFPSQVRLNFLEQLKICGPLTSLQPGPFIEEMKQKGITVSDVGGKDLKIEILIGADVAGALLTVKVHKLENGLVAVESLLGWTVMGEIPEFGVPHLVHLDRIDFIKRLRHLQSVRELLRRRFRLEYLSLFVQRPSTMLISRQITIRDIVFVECDNKRKVLWPLAKVTEIYPGKDVNIRVVRFKTASGELIRPIEKIFPLEIPSSMDSDEKNETETLEKENTISESPMNNSVPELSHKVRTIVTRSGRQITLTLKFKY
ncbi:N-acyl-phosphatidylethanolamine-hydrolyzing like protein [Argiope bruennichi]|uniref:N-acyl-phosphatidylethanolamine-hydrolyzing like protein n=1 Tax=Argiope bruennichi TaxID=94029 RepID=A0A8T0FK29_ARGBR|nr:N-acyl-phosphatidylethanolamine-hydrolyzing like protein [Argiope bruennichi]